MSFKLMALTVEFSFVRGWDTHFLRIQIKAGEKKCGEIFYIVAQVAKVGEVTVSFVRRQPQKEKHTKQTSGDVL